jgi:hypothetical protein
VAAGIEDGVEVFLPHAIKAKGLVELGFRGRVLFEANGEIGAEVGFVALGVERRASALWRGERNFNAGILGT